MVGRNVYRIIVDGVEICIQQLGRVEEIVCLPYDAYCVSVNCVMSQCAKSNSSICNSLKLTPPPEIVDRVRAVSLP